MQGGTLDSIKTKRTIREPLPGFVRQVYPTAYALKMRSHFDAPRDPLNAETFDPDAIHCYVCGAPIENRNAETVCWLCGSDNFDGQQP